MLVRHGPIPYPFPTSLLRKYERDYLASLPGFLYEFCAPSENAPS